MRVLAAVLLSLALAPSAFAGPPKAVSSIVGGQDASIAEWPSIAFVLSGWDQDGDGFIESQAQCTGSVVAPQWVISAAHCAFRPDGQPVDAMVTLTGIADLGQPGEAIAADRVVVHPAWNPQTLEGDALLVHLGAPSSRPALPVATHSGDYVTIEDVPNAAGWGATDEDATVLTNVLQEAYLEISDDCAYEGDPATQTCAGTQDVAGACKGDSGGPLLVFDQHTGAPVLWGLTSYGPQLGLGLRVCGLEAPAVFSWVPAFSGWIWQTLNPPGPGPRPSPPRPVISSPADITAPVISRARLSKRRLRVGKRITLSFELSEAAAVTVTVLKKRGRRYRALSPRVQIGASAGKVRRGLSARLGSRRLKPGSYRLRLASVDTAGNAGRVVKLSFRIVSAARPR